VFAAVAAWPFLDRESEPTHFAVDPMNRPKQTAVGVYAVTFVMVASLAGMNNIAADILGAGTGAINAVLWWAIVVWPTVCGVLTYALLRGDDGADGTDDGESDTRPADDGGGAE
jgi:cytochrome b-561